MNNNDFDRPSAEHLQDLENQRNKLMRVTMMVKSAKSDNTIHLLEMAIVKPNVILVFGSEKSMKEAHATYFAMVAKKSFFSRFKWSRNNHRPSFANLETTLIYKTKAFSVKAPHVFASDCFK